MNRQETFNECHISHHAIICPMVLLHVTYKVDYLHIDVLFD